MWDCVFEVIVAQEKVHSTSIDVILQLAWLEGCRWGQFTVFVALSEGRA